MSPRAAIAGIGLAGGFGTGAAALRQALARGTVAPVATDIPEGGGTARLPAYLADTAALERFVDRRALRRIDHFSRMGILGAFLALEDAGLLEADRRSLGTIVATGYGATRTTFAFLDSVMKDGDPLASPTLFSNSVHNAAAANISIVLGAAGPSLTVSQFEMSVPSALLSALDWLQTGRVDHVLFGGLDEYCDVLGYCWRRFFGPEPPAGIEPLAFDRQTALPGEGAAFFLLTRADREGSNHGYVEGVSMGNIRGGRPDIPGDALCLIGADGHRQCSSLYREILPAGARASACSQLYGSFPAGPAFDLAAAALLLKGAAGGPGSAAIVKAGREGDWGLITLSNKRSP